MLIPKTSKPYDFTLTIGSISDSIVVIHSDAMSFKKFFSELEKLTIPPQEDLLAHACSHLAPCIQSTWSSHGVSSLPQVRIGDSFRVLDIHGTVASLERCGPSPEHLKNPPLTHRSSDPIEGIIPIHPENKIVLPLYRKQYPDLIHVSPALCVTKHPSQTPLSYIPTAGTLLRTELFSTPSKYATFFGTALPLLSPFLADDKTAEQNCAAVIHHLSPPTGLFPLFVSMLHDSDSASSAGTMHHFHHIAALNEICDIETPFFGLLRFFRDSFLDASYRVSKNVFLIDNLTGFNDFSLFAKLFQHANKAITPAVDSIFLAHANETITLEHVIVITQGQQGGRGDEMSVSISFTYCGFSWYLQFSGTPQSFAIKKSWLFTRDAITPYAEHYGRCVEMDLHDYKHQPKTYADAIRRRLTLPSRS